MKVYLDNCVLIDVETGRLSLSEFKRKPNVEYFFSAAHMDELSKALVKRPEVKEIRLDILRDLCDNNYIVQDAPGYPMEMISKTPNDAFVLCQRYRTFKESIERLSESFSPNRDGILNELSLNKIEVANIPFDQIFTEVDKKMKKSKYGFGIDEYMQQSEAVTGPSKFSTLFNLLDSVCYWKDDRSINRMYDALHAYYAQYCDILVTDDKRMRIKAQAVYHYLQINTRVVASKEYINM